MYTINFLFPQPVSANEDSDEKIDSGDISVISVENAILLIKRVEYLNPLLRLFGSSPINKRKLARKRYSEEKSENIASETKKNFSIQKKIVPVILMMTTMIHQ